jgi:hypothetical protein
MTKHTQPVPAQSTPTAKADDALSDAALDKIAGGKPNSSLTKKLSETNTGVISKFG